MYVYREEEIRKIDRQAEKNGLSLVALMENAGREVFQRVKKFISKSDSIAILAGRGNNGGDGIVLARYLQLAGYDVALLLPLGEPKTVVAKTHLQNYEAQQFSVAEWDESAAFDVIIDALLGVGTKLPLRDNVRELITWANEQTAIRIAIDLPTGITANSGGISVAIAMDDNQIDNFSHYDLAFRADYTVALHGAKHSAFLHPSSSYYGKVEVANIGLKEEGDVRVIQWDDVVDSMPSRQLSSHKGTYGTSLIVAGTDEMPGSVALSAIGAIRSGTGRLIVATSERAIPIVAAHVPEATFIANGIQRIGEGDIPAIVTAAAIGPGLTDQVLTDKALDALLLSRVPVVVDAGALEKRDHWNSDSPVIITPHPGEFSRLTDLSVQYIQQNRIAVASQFAMEKSVTVVLKGQNTVIAFPNGQTFINPTGNSGLAKGGSGDVLTGIIVSFLATYEQYEDAVKNAVFIHGLCADEWAKEYSEAAMTASDFSRLLPVVLKRLEDVNV